MSDLFLFILSCHMLHMFVLEMHHYQCIIFIEEQEMFVKCNMLGCHIV